jgi:hypothetical protein
MHLCYVAANVPWVLMFAVLDLQETLCRPARRCVCHGGPDREIGTLHDDRLGLAECLFSYFCHEAQLVRAGLESLRLDSLGLHHVNESKCVRWLHAVDSMDDSAPVRPAVARRDVRYEHSAPLPG